MFGELKKNYYLLVVGIFLVLLFFVTLLRFVFEAIVAAPRHTATTHKVTETSSLVE